MTHALVTLATIQLAWSFAIVCSGLVARACRMRVDRVSLGYGRTIVSFAVGGTEWRIGWLLVGGFVQIAGRDATAQSIGYEDPAAFHNRPLLARMLPSVAMPVALMLFAGVMDAGANLISGMPTASDRAQVSGVMRGSPAERAGLKIGDEIEAVDGVDVTITTLPIAIDRGSGGPIEVTIRRGGDVIRDRIEPVKDGGHVRIGVQLDSPDVFVRSSAFTAIRDGLAFPFRYFAFILHGFAEIAAGKQKAAFSGPIGILAVSSRGAPRFDIVICTYLAFAFWFPVPPYPGGRALFILLGWRSRRRKLATPAREIVAPTKRALAPRVWVAAMSACVLDLLTQPARLLGPESSVAWLGLGLLLLVVVVLALPSVRRACGQSCPVCSTLGGRPVWSIPHTFGCVRCGSAWRES